MALILIMDDVPVFKLTAYSHAAFRKFIPINVDRAVPTNLAAYVWRAQLQIDRLHATAKLFDLTCTATATGVWLQAAAADLDALFAAPNAGKESRVIYGNLLFNQPDLAGVYCVAANIEMTVKPGATEWS